MKFSDETKSIRLNKVACSGDRCRPGLTVFDEPNCQGNQTKLVYEEGFESSNYKYRNYDKIAGWPDGSIASLEMEPGIDLEWFEAEDFLSDSFTFKHFGSTTCVEASHLPWKRMKMQETLDDGSTREYVDYGSRSLQYRKMVFPPEL